MNLFLADIDDAPILEDFKLRLSDFGLHASAALLSICPNCSSAVRDDQKIAEQLRLGRAQK